MKRGFNHLPAVIAQVPRSAERLVEKITVDIAAGAGATAPIDTGALAESYTAESTGLHGTAGTNMEYGPYVEYGTIHQSAQPHLVPSVERVAGAFNQHAEDFGDEIEGAARNG